MKRIKNESQRTILQKIRVPLDRKNARVLVVAGGSADYLVFKSLDFTNVTLTNIDPRSKKDDYYPFSYDFQDAENLT